MGNDIISVFFSSKVPLKKLIFFKSPLESGILKEKINFRKGLISSLLFHVKLGKNMVHSLQVWTFIKAMLTKNKQKSFDFGDKNKKKLIFSKYYYNGLGYKIFLRDKNLFIWVGLTHYTILRVPESIKIFAKKRRIFILGSNLLKFNEFLMQIRRIRKIDLYKGKGLLEIKSYKGFIKMKSGKKKQY